MSSGHLPIFAKKCEKKELDLMDQKMARAKKVVKIKNQFFHARQSCKGISEIDLLLGCFL